MPAGATSATVDAASQTIRQAALQPPLRAALAESGTLMSLGQPGLMHSLLAATGFTDIDVRALDAPMRLPSVKHCLGFVQTAGLPIMAILAPLPAAVQAAAWQEVEAQLLRLNRADVWVGLNELLLCTARRPVRDGVEPH